MGAVTEEPLIPHQAFHFSTRHSSSGQPGDNGEGGAPVSSQEVGQHGFLSLGDDLSHGFPPT